MEKEEKSRNLADQGEKEESGGISMSPPAFNLTAGNPIQRQTPEEGQAAGGGSIQERFASHTLTEADLADEYVTTQFEGLSIEQLFEYRRQCNDAAVKAHIYTLIDARERDPYQSYLGKKFTINSGDARLRNADGTEMVYQEGDEIPEGKRVGDAKVIPNGTEVYITDLTDNLRMVYAEDWGWTNIGNIQGGMFNETVSIDRAEYESTDPNHKTVATHTCTIHTDTLTTTYPAVSPAQNIPRNSHVNIVGQSADNAVVKVSMPDGTEVWTNRSNLSRTANEDGSYTVTDGQARIREESTEYAAAGGTVAQGERVIILAQSENTQPAGKYVQIAQTTKNEADQYVRDENKEPVWVQRADLADNWADYKSDNAQWRKSDEDRSHGVYLGQMDVVQVIGQESRTGRQELEKVSASLVPSYQELLAAARGAGHDMRINSAFRTYGEQQELRDLYLAGRGNEAAPAGRSNHQNGIAIDINTGGFNTPLYNWMVANGPTYHFIRTVSDEDWHWEYRPAEAAQYGYKLPSVSP